MSGPNRVDLARLAAVAGEPDIRRATAREANDLTGFVIGGIPPIGFDRPVRVIMDPDLGRYPTVWAAAGLPTAVFEVPPATLRTLANATVAPITEERRAADVEADATGADRRASTAGADGTTGRRLTGRPMARRNRDRVAYPGGLRARWRWGGSGQAADVFALSEAGGALIDLGPRVSADPDALCRAELRLEGPRGAWTARFASTIYDEPRADLPGHGGPARRGLRLPHVRAGRRDAASSAGTTARRRRSSRCSARRGSRHVLVQAEIETFALDRDGTVAWRVAHSDVVTAAELVGGRLVLTGFDGQLNALDPVTGRAGRRRPDRGCGRTVDNPSHRRRHLVDDRR